jgi:hypothetical protein
VTKAVEITVATIVEAMTEIDMMNLGGNDESGDDVGILGAWGV